MPHLPLFVFGTLRRGECNHGLLRRKYTRMLPAALHGFVRTHPLMIVQSKRGVVQGELYFLSRESYRQTIERCDRLEGIPPGNTAGEEYRRLEVTVETREGTIAAWAYVHPDTPADRVTDRSV